MPNDYALVEKTKHKRDVNRGLIDPNRFAEELKDPQSKRSHLRRMGSPLNISRTRERAFHPHGDQHIFMNSPNVFAVLRTSPEGDERILTMTNVTSRQTRIEIPLSEADAQETLWRDLLSGDEWIAEEGKLKVTLEPYDVLWLKGIAESKG